MRWTILLCAGVWLLPMPPEGDPLRAREAAMTPDGKSMLSAAARAVSDARGFCARQPEACQVAERVWRHVRMKVRYALRLLDARANGAAATPRAAGPGGIARPGDADPLITGSTTRPAARQRPRRDSESTLTIEDLLVPWLGPDTRRRKR
ncbi:MAG TPA: hypothetical protein ENK15_00500 [Thermopetrobacter sp.]|nr:hypothetical protein [Thermopetrobacter sp.]